MFSAIFGRGGRDGGGGGGESRQSSPPPPLPSTISQSARCLERLSHAKNATARRDEAFALRAIDHRGNETDWKDIQILVPPILLNFATTIANSDNDVSEDEETIQILVEMLSEALVQSPPLSAADLDPTLIQTLMTLADCPWSAWIRLVSIQALIVAHQHVGVIPSLLCVDQALDRLMAKLAVDSGEETVVRNAVISLLQILTEDDTNGVQIRSFLLFCDAASSLLQVALMEPIESPVAIDCLSIVLNSLKGNELGRRQFMETNDAVQLLIQLIEPPSPPPSPPHHTDEVPPHFSDNGAIRIQRALECVRLLVLGGNAESTCIVFGMNELFLSNLNRVLVEMHDDAPTLRMANYVLGDLMIGAGTKRDDIVRRVEEVIGFHVLVTRALEDPTRLRWIDFHPLLHAFSGAMQATNVCLDMLGHEIAPPPEDYGDAQQVIVSPIMMILQKLFGSVDALLELGQNIFVDPSRLSAAKEAVVRACRMWECIVANDLACRELSLRLLSSSGELVLDTLCVYVGHLSRTSGEDESASFRDTRNETCAEMLRLLFVWINGSKAVARRVLSSPGNLFLFHDGNSNHNNNGSSLMVQELCTLVVARLVVDTSPDVLATSLIESRMGFDTFSTNIKAVMGRCNNNNSNGMEYDLWDSETFRVAIRDTVANANRLVMMSASSTHHAYPPSGKGNHVGLMTAAAPSLENRSINSNSNPDYVSLQEFRALEKEHSELLLVLAHQEIDRQSLIETVLEIGGQQAVDKALARSAMLLATAFDKE